MRLAESKPSLTSPDSMSLVLIQLIQSTKCGHCWTQERDEGLVLPLVVFLKVISTSGIEILFIVRFLSLFAATHVCLQCLSFSSPSLHIFLLVIPLFSSSIVLRAVSFLMGVT